MVIQCCQVCSLCVAEVLHDLSSPPLPNEGLTSGRASAIQALGAHSELLISEQSGLQGLQLANHTQAFCPPSSFLIGLVGSIGLSLRRHHRFRLLSFIVTLCLHSKACTGKNSTFSKQLRLFQIFFFSPSVPGLYSLFWFAALLSIVLSFFYTSHALQRKWTGSLGYSTESALCCLNCQRVLSFLFQFLCSVPLLTVQPVWQFMVSYCLTGKKNLKSRFHTRGHDDVMFYIKVESTRFTLNGKTAQLRNLAYWLFLISQQSLG